MYRMTISLRSLARSPWVLSASASRYSPHNLNLCGVKFPALIKNIHGMEVYVNSLLADDSRAISGNLPSPKDAPCENRLNLAPLVF